MHNILSSPALAILKLQKLKALNKYSPQETVQLSEWSCLSHKQLKDLSQMIDTLIQPIFVSNKIQQELN